MGWLLLLLMESFNGMTRGGRVERRLRRRMMAMWIGSMREGGKLGECRRIVWRQFVALPASQCLDAIVAMPAIVCRGSRMMALDDGGHGERVLLWW